MKPIEIIENAEKFLQNLPITEPVIVMTSRIATLEDQSKMLVLSTAGVKVTLPESLTKDCSFTVITLELPNNNSVIATTVGFTRDLNIKADLAPAFETALNQTVTRIDCHYKAGSPGKWYIYKHIEYQLPNVLEVDYLQTVDQAGLTLPPASYGNKGGIPYFGEEPIREYLIRDFSHTYTAVSVAGFKLGPIFTSLPIPAGLMVPGYFHIEMILNITTSHLELLGSWGIMMDFDGGAIDGGSGSYMLFGGNVFSTMIWSGIMTFTENGAGKLTINIGSSPPPIVLGQPTSGQDITTPINGRIYSPAVEYADSATFFTDKNIANHINIRAAQVDIPAGRQIIISGFIKLRRSNSL